MNVDLTRITDTVRPWLAANGVPGDDLSNVRLLPGGTQNIALSFGRGGERFVLRSGPLHPRPNTNRNLIREMRFLEAFSRAQIPHAPLVAACTDEAVLGGSLFYVTRFVDGFNPQLEVPTAWRGDDGREIYLGLVDVLAQLGETDYEAIGLAGVGRPERFLSRQVARWTEELRSYCDLEGYSVGRLGDLTDLTDWLRKYEPPQARPGIIHGDFHVGNSLIDPASGEIQAVVDWEMATIGDPMLDLALLIALLPEGPNRTDILGSALSNHVDLPSEVDIVARYRRSSTRSVEHLDWYVALAAFKYAIVLEGSYARSLAGLVPADVGRRLGLISQRLIQRARERVGSDLR